MSETLINTNQNQLNNDDASFVEFIQQTQEGKENLTQAIINKGGNVSNSSTYDQLAQVVEELNTADGKGNYLVSKWCSPITVSQGFPATLLCARVLPHHNAMIGITTDGLLGVYKVSDEGRLSLIASDNTGFTPYSSSGYLDWHIFGFNRNETQVVWCDLNNKNLVVANIDWTNNTLDVIFTYTIEGDMGILQREVTYNRSRTRGLTISENGENILVLTTNGRTLYANIIIPNYNEGTAVEKIGYNNTGGIYIDNGEWTTGFSLSQYYYDSTNGIIEGLDAICGIFTINLDISGEYPIMSNLTYTHPRETTNGAHAADASAASWASFPLVFKYTLNKDFYVQVYGIDISNAVLFLNKYSEIKTYDIIKMKILSDRIGDSSYTPKLRFNYYNIDYYISNNEIYLLIGTWFTIKIDESGLTPKFVIINNNGTKQEDFYLTRTTYFGYDFRNLNITLSNVPNNKYIMQTNVDSGDYYGASGDYGSKYFLELKDACVLATKFTDSKNNENIMQISFDQSIYNAGGYRLINETNVLIEDE